MLEEWWTYLYFTRRATHVVGVNWTELYTEERSKIPTYYRLMEANIPSNIYKIIFFKKKYSQRAAVQAFERRGGKRVIFNRTIHDIGSETSEEY